MNWRQLNKDYPNAYRYMELNMNCLYVLALTNEDIRYDMMGNEVHGYIGTKKIKHPLKRDLYDFFDAEGLIIDMLFDDEEFIWAVFNSENTNDIHVVESGCAKSRPQAESDAFIKAFEILEQKITR